MALTFQNVLDAINANYDFYPTAFGVTKEAPNPAGQNEGACRVLAFAKDQNLDKETALKLFAEHYQNVLDDPAGDNHQNIRLLMRHGLGEAWFDETALARKPTYDGDAISKLIALAK